MSPKEQPPPGFQTQAGTENTHKNVCMCARIFAMTAFSFNLVLLKVNTIEMWAVCMYDRKKEECEKGRQNKDAAASNNLNIVFFNPTDDYFTSPTTQIKPTVQWHVYELYHVSNTAKKCECFFQSTDYVLSLWPTGELSRPVQCIMELTLNIHSI